MRLSRLWAVWVLILTALAGCSEDEPVYRPATEEEIAAFRVRILRAQPVYNGETVIAAGATRSWTFSTDGYESPKLTLTFSETAGKTIEARVYDAVGWANVRAGVAAVPLYASGRVAAGTATVPLPSGGMCTLMLDNSFSWFTLKTVAVSATVNYEAWE